MVKLEMGGVSCSESSSRIVELAFERESADRQNSARTIWTFAHGVSSMLWVYTYELPPMLPHELYPDRYM